MAWQAGAGSAGQWLGPACVTACVAASLLARARLGHARAPRKLAAHADARSPSSPCPVPARHGREKTPAGEPAIWRFPHASVFEALDGTLERVQDALGLSQAAARFAKLESMELGGSKVCRAHANACLGPCNVAGTDPAPLAPPRRGEPCLAGGGAVASAADPWPRSQIRARH